MSVSESESMLVTLMLNISLFDGGEKNEEEKARKRKRQSDKLAYRYYDKIEPAPCVRKVRTESVCEPLE